MESGTQSGEIPVQTAIAQTQTLKYVHLLSFAKISRTEDGKPSVILLDKKGNSEHNDDNIPLVFMKELQDSQINRVFDTVLNDAKNTPVKLINVLAEFEEDWFNTHKDNIKSFKSLSWDDLMESDGRVEMTPIDKP